METADALTNATSGSKKKRSNVVCTACRQVKLRCDVRDAFPAPCSRCKKLKKDCQIDPSFKRTSTRGQLQAVTSELTRLKERLAEPSITLAAQLETPPPSATIEDAAQGQELLLFETAGHGEQAYSLKEFLLDLAIADQLFSFYGQYIHPQLPLVATNITASALYKKNPLLFWTIAIISCQRHVAYRNLYSWMSEAYEDLLGRACIAAPLTLSSVQALVLICWWPLTYPLRVKEPSWLLCGVAIHAARKRVVTLYNDRTSQKNSAWINTWLACFHVSTAYALHHGIPSPIDSPSDLAVIESLVPSSSLPIAVKGQIRALVIIVQNVAILRGNIDDTSRLTTIRQVETSLDNAFSSTSILADNQDQTLTLLHHRCKLEIYSIALFAAQSSANTTKIGSVTTVAGLNAAIRIIECFHRMLEKEIPVDNAKIRPHSSLIPSSYMHSFAFATLFLIRFCLSNKQISAEGQLRAENAVKEAYSSFVRHSSQPQDEAGRAAQVVKLLASSEFLNTERATTNSPFWGVSVIPDALRAADELRGRDKSPESRVNEESEGRGDVINQQQSGSLQSPPDKFDFDVADLGSLDELLMGWTDLTSGVWPDNQFFHDDLDIQSGNTG